jgi:hypothetical protein
MKPPGFQLNLRKASVIFFGQYLIAEHGHPSAWKAG